MTTIKVTKDMRGSWKGEDDFELGGDRILRISTHKTSSGALVSTATGHKRVGQGALQHTFGMGVASPEDDFRKTMASSKPARCTSRTVVEQHGDALARSAALVADAIAYYAAQDAQVKA